MNTEHKSSQHIFMLKSEISMTSGPHDRASHRPLANEKMVLNNNQRSQRDDSRIQKEENKANDYMCKLQYDVSIFSYRRQSDFTKCPLMFSQCEIMISRLV